LTPFGPAVRSLRIISRLNVGGPARHAVLLDAGLRAHGWETLLVHGRVSPGEASFEHLATERSLPTQPVTALGRRIQFWDDARAFVGIWRAIRRFRPAVVHTHTAKAGTLGRLAAAIHNATLPRSQRCVVLHTFHGHVLEGYFSPLGSALVRIAERTLARLTDCTIVISELQRRDLVDRFRIIAAGRAVVIPLGLELGDLLALPTRQPDTSFTIGYVGRLVPIKNVESLICAFALVRESIPAARLVIAGDGPERSRLEALVRRLELARYVEFRGWCADLPDLYATFDALALTSLNEGTPVALIEAMAAGVPVVATSVGGVPDVVGDAMGVLTTTGVEAIAQGLLDVASDPTAALIRAARARDHVRSRYDAARLVDRVAGLYGTLVQSKRAAGSRRE
jgi:glycosyltransferase involved in cell wall biosynthesis